MEEKIQKIKSNPLHYMSLANTELFHSNFWAWLIDNDKSFAKIFFEDIDVNDIESVGRENGNRDLTIYMKHGEKEKCHCYVIENKIKSIPSNEQLTKYQKDIEQWGIFEMGCLTGLLQTLEFNNENSNWNFLSYSDISKQILEIANKSTNPIIEDNLYTIRQYCDYLDNLSDILIFYLEQKTDELNYENKKLADLRYEDIYKKIIASKFLEYFNKKYKEYYNDKAKTLGYTYCYWTGFSNKHAIIDLRFEKNVLDADNKKITEVNIGVQLEEYQFRKIAQRANWQKSNQFTLENVYEEFENYGWFESGYTKSNGQIFGKSTKLSKTYNSYKNNQNNYFFVYQYFDIKDELLKFENLAKEVKKCLDEALEKIETNKINVKESK